MIGGHSSRADKTEIQGVLLSHAALGMTTPIRRLHSSAMIYLIFDSFIWAGDDEAFSY